MVLVAGGYGTNTLFKRGAVPSNHWDLDGWPVF